MKYDFDMVINRQNAMSIKYDFAKRLGKPEGILPLGVLIWVFRRLQRFLKH